MATRRPLFLPEFSAIKPSKAPLASIGISQEGDGSWFRLFNSIFCVLGHNGDVLHSRFTRVGNRSMKFPTSLDLNQPYQSFGIEVIFNYGLVINNCRKYIMARHVFLNI